jgi:hypothetical protein
MNHVAQLLGLLIALAICQAAPGRLDSDGITVRLSLEKPRYSLAEQIQVRVQVENQSGRALIVSNLISDVDNREGFVQFSLTDAEGNQQLPQIKMISDSFAPFPHEPDWAILLGRWFVLYPKSSISSYLTLDGSTFPFLTKPGKYELTASYSSAGLSYPLNYRRVGLTAQNVESLRFTSWSGKVRSNSIPIEIVANK